jgi:hypothetical protein
MTDRWVCKRCFADNDGSAGSCARCGLLRGSEVPDADRAAWAEQTGAPPPAAGTAAGWQRWLRFWWIPAIAIALAVGYFTTARRGDDGALSGGGTLSVNDLRVGDCFSTDGATEIAEVQGVPCTEPHTFEVFAVHTYDGPLPLTDESSEVVFLDLCQGEFETYVGAPYATSAIYGSMISPSEETYADGDREYVCVLFEPDPDDFDQDLVLTESLRGAAR